MKKLLVYCILAILAFGKTASADDASNVKVKGDFRYRHELIDQDGKDSRTRQRIRARVNVIGKVNENATVTIGLSSGSADPVSNNQTLSDGWSTKDAVLDLAFVEITPVKLPGLELVAGKMHNPFYLPGKSELVWDSDIRQEGIAANFHKDLEGVSLMAMGGGFYLEERSSGENSFMLSGQGVIRVHLPEKTGNIALGGSYYRYENAKGYTPFFNAGGSGNSLMPDTSVSGSDTTITMLYAEDYELLEVFLEGNFKAGKTPVTLFGDYVTNTAADSLNDGWMVGISIGQAKKPGSWNLRYNYREIKADAVVGMYTDSDFIGGGTDGKGHEFGGSIVAADNISLAATYFVNKIDINKEINFNRLQLDAIFKF